MIENYEHYITKNIKALYKRRLVYPIVYVITLLILWIYFSLSDLLFPVTLSDSSDLSTAYGKNIQYVHTTVNDLQFTGYTQTKYGRTTGYYYYTKSEDGCLIVLLSPTTCEQGLPSMESVTITGKLAKKDTAFATLLENLSSDLDWTSQGITSKVSPYYLSQPGYHKGANIFLFGVIFLTGGYALLCIVLFILFINVPFLSPPCQDLALFGHPKELLAQAEEELATLPQLATEDMFITEHYFIETSKYGTAIVPIDQIIWIYKYSTLHQFFWYHFSISYTLHISANKHLYIRCPKNIKSDIDGIMDYLAEANHNILVGFNEKNRLKVQEIQGTPMHFEKIIALLKKRI